MFLGLEDPDPDPSILPASSTKSKKKPWFLLFCDFYMTFYLWRMMEMYLQKVKSKKRRKKHIVAIMKATEEKSRTLILNPMRNSLVRIDPDPYPYQIVTKPQHWLKHFPSSLAVFALIPPLEAVKAGLEKLKNKLNNYGYKLKSNITSCSWSSGIWLMKPKNKLKRALIETYRTLVGLAWRNLKKTNGKRTFSD
jgi:hypothetical protein